PVAHAFTQAPDEQVWLAAQALLQAPQLAELTLVSTQVPLHSAVPVGQPQAPPMQALPPLQTGPHAPQFLLSDLVSTQAPLQAVSGVAQPAVHCPIEQT